MSFLLDPLYLIIATGVSLLFNLVLLILVIKLRTHYNSLTKGVKKKQLLSVLEGIQKTLAGHERTIAANKKGIKSNKELARLHIQNLSLKRFNPFSDTGGDQSFILGVLDGNNDGVVITSLHSRENTRFYVKSVKDGVGTDHPLSREEKKVIK